MLYIINQTHRLKPADRLRLEQVLIDQLFSLIEEMDKENHTLLQELLATRERVQELGTELAGAQEYLRSHDCKIPEWEAKIMEQALSDLEASTSDEVSASDEEDGYW